MYIYKYREWQFNSISTFYCIHVSRSRQEERKEIEINQNYRYKTINRSNLSNVNFNISIKKNKTCPNRILSIYEDAFPLGIKHFWDVIHGLTLQFKYIHVQIIKQWQCSFSWGTEQRLMTRYFFSLFGLFQWWLWFLIDILRVFTNLIIPNSSK